MAITSVTVVGEYTKADGGSTPSEGTVTFLLNDALQDTSGLTIVGRTPVVATLVDGAFSIVLAATDDVGVIPTNATYHVTEVIDGETTEFDIPISNAASPINLAAIPRATSSAPKYTYVEYQEFLARMELLRRYVGGVLLSFDTTIDGDNVAHPVINDMSFTQGNYLVFGAASVVSGTGTITDTPNAGFSPGPDGDLLVNLFTQDVPGSSVSVGVTSIIKYDSDFMGDFTLGVNADDDGPVHVSGIIAMIPLVYLGL